MAREQACTFIIDEFYSHFHYTPDGAPAAGPVSAASHIDDVETDPVLLIDGLTKCFRYPGWRVGWIVGHAPARSEAPDPRSVEQQPPAWAHPLNGRLGWGCVPGTLVGPG